MGGGHFRPAAGFRPDLPESWYHPYRRRFGHSSCHLRSVLAEGAEAVSVFDSLGARAGFHSGADSVIWVQTMTMLPNLASAVDGGLPLRPNSERPWPAATDSHDSAA